MAEFHRQLMAVVTPLRRECDVRICYVDDGSGDGTAAELGKLRADDPAITVLTLSRNFGQQAALTAGLDRARAQDLVDKAHVVCPYSHATRGNIDVKLSVA